MPLPILFDGWPLVYQPNGPAALHLYSLLSLLPEPAQALLALPGVVPDWLPPVQATQVIETPDTPLARLRWEQRVLPGLAKKLGARLLHHTVAAPPLFGAAASVLSPTAASSWQREVGFAGRLRASLSAGGMTRLRALFWAEDLPAPAGSARLYRLPAVLDPVVSSPSAPAAGLPDDLELPESYVLYHGPVTLADLNRLLGAWSWAAGALGEQVSLVLAGLDDAARQQLLSLAQSFDLVESVFPLAPLSPRSLPALYQGSLALFHPAPEPPWGGSLRLALDCSLPVVAAASPLAEAIVGPAAYLLPPEDLRGLGAALITVVVEEEVSARLSQAGKQRASAWQAGGFGSALLAAYEDILSRGVAG